MRRTFEEEEILKKLAFEKTQFMRELLPGAEALRQAGYCRWQEAVQKNTATYQSPMAYRRANTASDIANMVGGLETDKSFLNSSILQRLCQSLKEKTAALAADWGGRRQHVVGFLETFKVDCSEQKIEGVPPIDEGSWLKSDMLYANSKVVAQDIGAKIGDAAGCLQQFNRFYDVLKAAMADLYVDPSRKAPGVSEQLQVWNQEDFAGVLRAIDSFLEEAREDQLTCTQLLTDLRERADLGRVKTEALAVAKKFASQGRQAQMDDAWIGWLRGMAFSLQAWSNIFGQRLAKASGLFEDSTELLFLTDRVFPFILEQVRRVAQEGKFDGKAEERAADWKDLSVFLKGMDIRLSHLQARLAARWPEGAKAVSEMLARSGKLKKVVSFMWGEVSAKRIYSKLSHELAELTGTVGRMQLDKNYRYDKQLLAALADKVFTLVEDFGAHENLFLKYKALDVPAVKGKVVGLRDGYEKLCMRLAGFGEDEALARQKQAGDVKQKITTPTGIVGRQATQPELNDGFIRNGRSA